MAAKRWMRYWGTFGRLAVLAGAALAGAGLAVTALAQNTTTFGTIVSQGTPCGAANCVYYELPAGTPWVNVTVTGTWSGTLEMATTTAANANYSNLSTIAWTVLATETTNGAWSASTGGATYLRVRATSWTSGSAKVGMASAQAPLSNPVFPGQVTASGGLVAGSVGVTYPDGTVQATANSGVSMTGSTPQIPYISGANVLSGMPGVTYDGANGIAVKGTFTAGVPMSPGSGGTGANLSGVAGQILGFAGSTNAMSTLTPTDIYVDTADNYTQNQGQISLEYGIRAFTDSVGACYGVYPQTLTSCWYLGVVSELNTFDAGSYRESGTSSLDMSLLVAAHFAPDASERNPATIIEEGKNDQLNYATTTTYGGLAANLGGLIDQVAMPPEAGTYFSMAKLSTSPPSNTPASVSVTSVTYTPAATNNPVQLTMQLSGSVPSYWVPGYKVVASGFTTNSALNGVTLTIDHLSNSETTSFTPDQVTFVYTCSSCSTATDAGTLALANWTFPSGTWADDGSFTTSPNTGLGIAATAGGGSIQINSREVGSSGTWHLDYVTYPSGGGSFQVTAVPTAGGTSVTLINQNNNSTTTQSACINDCMVIFPSYASIAQARFTGLTPNTLYNFTITCTGKCGFYREGSTHDNGSGGSSSPSAVVVTNWPEGPGSLSGNYPVIFNNWEKQIVLASLADGERVIPVDPFECMNPNVDFTGTLGASASQFPGPTSSAPADFYWVHPGSGGAKAIRQCVIRAMKAASNPYASNFTSISQNLAGQTTTITSTPTVLFQNGGTVNLGPAYSAGPVTVYNTSTSASLTITPTNIGPTVTLSPNLGCSATFYTTGPGYWTPTANNCGTLYPNFPVSNATGGTTYTAGNFNAGTEILSSATITTICLASSTTKGHIATIQNSSTGSPVVTSGGSCPTITGGGASLINGTVIPPGGTVKVTSFDGGTTWVLTSAKPVLKAASAAWNNSNTAIPANSCVAGPTAVIPYAQSGWSLAVNPQVAIGTSFQVGFPYISANSGTATATATAQICNVTATASTPTSSNYLFVVTQP